MLIYGKLRGIILNTKDRSLKTFSEEGKQMAETEVGRVMDFFARPVVAGIDVTDTLKVGDRIHIKGHTTDIEMDIASMQINNENVSQAKKGDSVGIKVPDRVRVGDLVYKVT
jgi:translation initiation factor IF-2